MNQTQESLLVPLLTLFIALFGFAIIVTRGRVIGWFLRTLLAPLRLIFGAAMMGALIFAILLFLGVNFSSVSSVADSIRQLWTQVSKTPLPSLPGGSGVERVILTQYAPLSQMNPANYRGGNVSALAMDDSVERRYQTCLSAIYTSLARAHGAPSAMIEDYYSPKEGAMGYAPLGGLDTTGIPYDAELILVELRAGRPVILVGKFGKIFHYVLVVGYERQPDGLLDFWFNDPWPKRGSDHPGRQLRMDGNTNKPTHPEWGIEPLKFEKMRYVRL